MKLSDAQFRALETLPVEIAMWGGKPHSSMPAGVRSRATLWSLYKMGLAALNVNGLHEKWSATKHGCEEIDRRKPKAGETGK